MKELNSNLHRPKIFYGWFIVAAGSVTSFLNLGIFMVGIAVFITDIRAELGWSLAAISLGFSLKQLESGIMAPIGGILIDRVGPRPMAIIGSITMTVGLLLFARMHSIWIFYLAATIIAIGQGLGALTAYLAAAMHWFRKKRGMASAVLAMGRGWGYVGAVPVTLLLASFGWRTAAIITALAFSAISVPLAMVIRNRPEPYGYLPDGINPEIDEGNDIGNLEKQIEPDGFTVLEAVRSPAFWLVLISNTSYSFTTAIQHVHWIPHLRHTGFSAPAAGTIIAIYGGTQVFGRLMSGWVGDKIGRQRLLWMSFSLISVGWVAMSFISPETLWAVGAFYLFYGAGQAAHTVAQPTVIADFFGPKRFASIRGIMNPISVLGGVIGPVLTGFMFDSFESYRLIFALLAPVSLVGSIAIFLAKTPTQQIRDTVT